MADSRSIIGQRSGVNTGAISTSTTVLAANTQRSAWEIQNLSTSTLFILMGSGCSSTVFHRILKGCTAQDDGTGGVYSQYGPIVYTGIITAGTASLRYAVTEIT